MKKVIFSIVVVLFVTLAVGLSVAQLPLKLADEEPIGGGGGATGCTIYYSNGTSETIECVGGTCQSCEEAIYLYDNLYGGGNVTYVKCC